MRLARALWRVRPTRLRDVCRFLAIAHTRPHDAEADARACAAIAIAALEDGRGLERGRLPAQAEVRRRRRRRINDETTADQPRA
jgi:DNA polymerase-3 subunit epsilon